MKSGFARSLPFKVFATVALTAISTLAFAQVQAPTQRAQASAADVALQRICTQQACQRNVSVAMRDAKGNQFRKTFPLLPPVVEGSLFTITAGQSLFIEADIAGSKVTNYRVVPGMQNPAKTLIVSLLQLNDARTQLYVVNPFAQDLKFSVGVLPLGSDKMVKTSSCPIQARKPGSIIWDKPVLQVALGNGVALAPSAPFAPFACSE